MEAPKNATGPITAAEALRIKASHFATYADDNEAMICRHPTAFGRKKARVLVEVWRSASAELEEAARQIEAEEGER